MWVAIFIIMGLGFALSVTLMLFAFAVQLMAALLPVIFAIAGAALKFIFLGLMALMYRAMKRPIERSTRRKRLKKQKGCPGGQYVAANPCRPFDVVLGERVPVCIIKGKDCYTAEDVEKAFAELRQSSTKRYSA